MTGIFKRRKTAAESGKKSGLILKNEIKIDLIVVRSQGLEKRNLSDLV